MRFLGGGTMHHARQGGSVAAKDAGSLAPPAVSADVYDEEYFRRACGGHEEWTTSGGAVPAGMYPAALRRACFRPGETLVDIGAGRGELVALAAREGAKRAIGVDYAAAAVRLAQQTLAINGVVDRAEVTQGDARALHVADAAADLVTMLDVAEHLAPAELD